MRTRFTLMLLAVAAAPLGAQRAHQWELGVFGSFARLDRAFGLDHPFGGGGRLAYFLGETVGVEIDAGYQRPHAAAGGATPTLLIGAASVVLNFGGERNSFYLLGGYSRVALDGPAPHRFTDHGVHGALGDRIVLGPGVALRLEGRGVYAPATGLPGGEWAGHVVGSIGLSLFAGAGVLRDADRDGVGDRRDSCPGTPAGAVPDPVGCPVDADRDGVFNGLDACPHTVDGAQVDAGGCPVDADADGVYDGLDRCAATPTGARVDGQGCPADADGDGVADGLDVCPDTPVGAAVGATGCPIDGDRDGVPDGLDKCPGTPAGTEVDAAGCQRAGDADGDGVLDPRDACPGTATGTQVDGAGCPILFASPRTPVVLREVTFATGRSALRSESFAVLDIVAASLVANPEIRIEIAGHTDTTGSEAVNRVLSQARADAVRAYLARKGVVPARMVARGYGSSVPVATNTTAAGRAQNRRVELRQLP